MLVRALVLVLAATAMCAAGCGSDVDGGGPSTPLGGSCSKSAACQAPLRCAEEPTDDDPSVCTKDCTSDAECGDSRCVATNIGPNRRTICVKKCTQPGKTECSPWTCNTTNGACEPK
jgi:hypothetical protein